MIMHVVCWLLHPNTMTQCPIILKFGWKITLLALFFHFLPLISLWIFHYHLLEVFTFTTTVRNRYAYSCTGFSTLTAHFEAEFPSPKAQIIIIPLLTLASKQS